MNKTMKRNVVISAVLAIVLCASLITGATFALFTSGSETNIAVTSGTVDVVATIDNIDLGSELEGNLPETRYEITNGNELALTGMVPGDYITFDLKVANNSSVTIKYRTLLKVATDNGLWDGLVVTIGEEGTAYDGQTMVADWDSLAPGADPATVSVRISLPRDAGNVYQGKTCSINYTVEAVQGNADVTDPYADAIKIYTVNDLKALSTNVAINADANYYAGKTVLLMNDLDLAGSDFNGIGRGDCEVHPAATFCGTFEGNGHTIYNMSIDCDANAVAAAGFFSTLGGNACVQNLKFENANVKSTLNAGVVVGYAHGTGIVIKNCSVVGSTVTSVPEIVGGSWDSANNVGGIAGFGVNATIENCSVSNTAISAYRKIGGIAGSIMGAVNDCTVSNVSICVNDVHNYKNFTTLDAHMVGSMIGFDNGCTLSGNNGEATFSQAALVTNATELKDAILAGGNIIVCNDIDMTGTSWDPEVNDGNRLYSVYLEGNGHVLTGLTNALINCEANANVTIRNLTVTDATIGNDHNDGLGIAAFVGYVDTNCTVTLYNCHLTESSVIGTSDFPGVAGLIGYKSTNGNLTVKSCSVKDCTITGVSNGAGVVGYLADSATITGCTIEGNTIQGENAEKTGDIVGTVNSGVEVVVNGCTYDNNAYGRLLANSRLILDGTVYCSAAYLGSVLTAGGANVTLQNDYVLLDNWTSFETTLLSLSIDGGDHSISGLTRPLLAYDAAQNVTIKNLTIKNSDIVAGTAGNDYQCGAFIAGGDNHMGSLTMDHCTADNVTVTGGSGSAASAGALVGHWYSTNANTNLSITNCTVNKCTVTGPKNAGGIVGFVGTMSEEGHTFVISNCTVSNDTIVNGGEYAGRIVAVVNNGGTLQVTDCTFTGLVAKRVTTGTTVAVASNGTTVNYTAGVGDVVNE